jgi:hypothetical protein
MSENDNEEIPINCSFTINKEDLPSGSESIDLSDDCHKDEIIDIVRNSYQLEEWVEEIASSRIESDYSYEIEKGEQAYDQLENLDLEEFEEFKDLQLLVRELNGDDQNSDLNRLWKEVGRLHKVMEEVARLFATWSNFDPEQADEETIAFFGTRNC